MLYRNLIQKLTLFPKKEHLKKALVLNSVRYLKKTRVYSRLSRVVKTLRLFLVSLSERMLRHQSNFGGIFIDQLKNIVGILLRCSVSVYLEAHRGPLIRLRGLELRIEIRKNL